ncbi:hypothetical protein BDR22DRAFT_826336 [Usnea florida]
MYIDNTRCNEVFSLLGVGHKGFRCKKTSSVPSSSHEIEGKRNELLLRQGTQTKRSRVDAETSTVSQAILSSQFVRILLSKLKRWPSEAMLLYQDPQDQSKSLVDNEPNVPNRNLDQEDEQKVESRIRSRLGAQRVRMDERSSDSSSQIHMAKS